MFRFIHTADLHLGKTYRNSPGEKERYEDFFRMLASIVADAIAEKVDAVLIAGDLFHTGQILPRTFARTIETLQPLKDAGIPCVAVEGNHDWIHRRDSISWMEALSQMGYLRLLRPSRTESGGFQFEPFDAAEGQGGHLAIEGANIYGLGYIGTHAGAHVPRLCEAVTTENNILLFHVGIWTFSPVEIGNMRPEEAAPLAGTFAYVALGHGHKPYIVETADGRPYAFNPGSPERVNFGEQTYDKGYYLVTLGEGGAVEYLFRETDPRPLRNLVIDLSGATCAEEAMAAFRAEVPAQLPPGDDPRPPLVELKLVGKVGFHPFELGRERLRLALDEMVRPLHVEVKNLLSLVTKTGEGSTVQRTLEEIERDVLRDLVGAASDYQGREDELVDLALALRRCVQQGQIEEDEMLALLDQPKS